MAEFMGRFGVAPNGNGMHNPAEATEVPKNGDGAHVAPEAGNGSADGKKRGGGAGTTCARLEEGLGVPGRDAADPMRDRLGRFQPHNQGGPGNPFGRQVARNRRLILTALSDEEVLAVVRKLHEQALAGNVAASKLLLQYVAGKPAAAADPDRVHHEEWKLRQEQPTVEDMVATSNRCPHALALMVNRAADPGKFETMGAAFEMRWAKDDARQQKRQERAERVRRRKEERRRRKEERRRRKHGG
jgi:hypothetical protein